MLSPNTHLLIFIFQLNGLTIAVHVSIARPLWLTAGLHCVFYARAKMCMFAETQSTLTHFNVSHWSVSLENSPVLYNILQTLFRFLTVWVNTQDSNWFGRIC